MTQHFKNSIINIIIFVTFITSIISCGSDDDPSIMGDDYLPLDIGNSWVFINPEYPDAHTTISITGITTLSDGRTATVVTAVGDGDEEGDKGYVSKTVDGLLLAHAEIDDLHGELFYIPTIEVGTRWEGDRGRGAEVIAREDANTPAGVFQNCFRIDVLDEGDRFATVWIAKNVGPIKLQEIENVDTGEVLCMWFSPDGQTLTSAIRDGWITRLDVDTGKSSDSLKLELPQDWGGIVWASFSPDGLTLAGGAGTDEMCLWNTRTGEHVRTLTGDRASFSPDGQMLAIIDSGDAIQLWDVSTERALRTLSESRYVQSVSFSPDGQMLAIGGFHGEIVLWDVSIGAFLRSWTGHPNEVYNVSFSSDGMTLASGGDDGVVHVWDVGTGELRHTFIAHPSGEVSVSFSVDGTTLASGGRDGTVRLWDVNTGQLLRTLEISTWEVVRETIVLEKFNVR